MDPRIKCTICPITSLFEKWVLPHLLLHKTWNATKMRPWNGKLYKNFFVRLGELNHDVSLTAYRYGHAVWFVFGLPGKVLGWSAGWSSNGGRSGNLAGMTDDDLIDLLYTKAASSSTDHPSLQQRYVCIMFLLNGLKMKTSPSSP